MTPPDTKSAVVHLQRTISAPPGRVYRAWLEPELARQWLSPAQFTASRVEVDERVGGRHSTWHTNAEGEDLGGMEGEILELVPDRRVSFRWWFVGPDRDLDPAFETRLTVSFEPGEEPGTTELTLVHERLEAADRGIPGLAAAATEGWNQALDKLVAAV
jgi:uncharacterized protein YndB with AHSA1/START domain